MLPRRSQLFLVTCWDIPSPRRASSQPYFSKKTDARARAAATTTTTTHFLFPAVSRAAAGCLLFCWWSAIVLSPCLNPLFCWPMLTAAAWMRTTRWLPGVCLREEFVITFVFFLRVVAFVVLLRCRGLSFVLRAAAAARLGGAVCVLACK